MSRYFTKKVNSYKKKIHAVFIDWINNDEWIALQQENFVLMDHIVTCYW